MRNGKYVVIFEFELLTYNISSLKHINYSTYNAKEYKLLALFKKKKKPGQWEFFLKVVK